VLPTPQPALQVPWLHTLPPPPHADSSFAGDQAVGLAAWQIWQGLAGLGAWSG
jgi:hypothetical protein